MSEVINKIFGRIDDDPSDAQCYEDLFELSRLKEDHSVNKRMRELLAKHMSIIGDKGKAYMVYKKSLLFDAPDDFDSFLLYIELNRKPEERFYQPRRRVMKRVVDALQKLADDELDELFLSMPPRVGKSSLMIFFVCWIMGRNSEHPNLYSSYSDTITQAFYNGVLEVLQDPDTYLYHDVFPHTQIVRTNSKDETLDLDRKKHYPSLTCRSLYGTLNGACDAEKGFIISDDLIGGIEEALNKDRLISAWGKVDNNLIPRGKAGTKYLWIGTRWSVIDPTGIRLDLLMNDEKYRTRRYEVINLPALDENDESNFEYRYDVGFNTEYYQQRRASFERNNDIASWLAQYMGEPIEREGTLFTPEDFRYYNGELPLREPDRIFMPVDPAFGGGDFVAAPILFQYDNDIYVHDVVYNNGDKKVTQPLLVNAIKRHNITTVQIEANKSTESYKEGIEELLKKDEIRINMTTKPAPSDKSKNQRIFDKAPDIREMMIFRESGKRSREYELFMQNVYSFKMFAKNKNDDAPDSLSMGIDMLHVIPRKAEIFKRMF